MNIIKHVLKDYPNELLNAVKSSDLKESELGKKMVVNADLSNIVHFPTDCPHREKQGCLIKIIHYAKIFKTAHLFSPLYFYLLINSEMISAVRVI